MSAIYILSDAGKLTKKDETIVFAQSDGTSTILFPFKTEQLVLIGNVSITGDALRMISKYKIPVTMLSSNGKFNAKIVYEDSKNVFLRQKQYRILDTPAQSLEIARSIVSGKIKNQISFMQRIKRKSKQTDSQIQDAVNESKNYLERVDTASSIDEIRGYEGITARRYFRVFSLNIAPDWAVFKGRSKNPPQTNVNAVLSFLYTLLLYRVEGALESQGLDVMAGNLHAVNYGKSALVFDLMEEFRSAIADSVCCSLFNLGVLKEDDFETVDTDSDTGDYPSDGEETAPEAVRAVLLKKPALKKVIASFEEKMDTVILYAPDDQKISYQRIIFEQAKHYKRVISGEETRYKPYYFK